ncbi:MAG TPA: NAD-dependent epimerase/dehydratase family protein [Burkholderiales bacterium]|nr:NAD-dependent epimerase/dehydratase family protein [Burkholderiales bacterium]
MKVFVTDAGTSFAQALLPALCRSEAVEAVTGGSTQPLPFEDPKFQRINLERGDAVPAEILRGHDALVHLASRASLSSSSPADSIDASVRPIHKLFQEAHAAGVQRLVHLSSAAVYGPAVHANEQSPLRPLAGFAYAERQAHLERLLEIDFPHCVRLRPHLVVGPHAHPAVRRLLRQPFYPKLGQPQPLFQCVHEDDLANAVLLSLHAEARGAYNIASEDSFTLRDAIRTRRGFSFGVSIDTAGALVRFGARYFVHEIDRSWIERAAHTVLINCRRAIAELGWHSLYTARQAIAAT